MIQEGGIDKVKKGTVLISQPYLGDPNFERTVILICEHNEEGTFGLVLNHLSNVKFSEVMDDIGDFDTGTYIGGPVEQNTLHFLHTMDLDGAVELSKGLKWSGDYEALKFKMQTGQVEPEGIRLFLGYSGWSVGQLGEEFERESWFASNNFADKVLSMNPDTLWREILKEMGGKYKRFANYPIDPSLN